MKKGDIIWFRTVWDNMIRKAEVEQVLNEKQICVYDDKSDSYAIICHNDLINSETAEKLTMLHEKKDELEGQLEDINTQIEILENSL